MGFGGGAAGLLSRLRLLVILTIAMAVLLAVAPVRPVTAELDAEEQALLALLNQYRAANGIAPLSLNSKLNEAARWMSKDMAAYDYFSHTDSLGRGAAQRRADFGYTYNTWKGENLAAGVDTAQAAFELWKGSPGHNANILNANFKVVGIDRAYGEGTTHGWYWTTAFGGEGDPLPPAKALAPEPSREPTPEPPPAPLPEPPPTPPLEPPPAPPLEPAPQVAPERALEPSQEPTPESTPQPPNRHEIVSWLRPWWERLNPLDADSPVLRTVSYIADRYLALRTGVFDPRTTSGFQPTYTKD